jgi:hypothetical protein
MSQTGQKRSFTTNRNAFMNMSPMATNAWCKWDISACLAVASCISADRFVSLAVEGLEICCSAVETSPHEVRAVAKVGRSDWSRGHDAFDAVRILTLAAEKIPPAHRADHLLLFVAENAARMIYNASGTKRPFDDDSGGWLIRTFGEFTESLPQSRRTDIAEKLGALIQQAIDVSGLLDDAQTANTAKPGRLVS